MSVRFVSSLLPYLVIGSAASATAQVPVVDSTKLIGTPAPVNDAEWAYDRFVATGAASVLEPAHEGDYVQFPFGHGEARVRCARLQVCPIELQAGERLLDEPLTGDTERWIVDTSVSGRNGEVPLVIVKPTNCDLTTNVLLLTDRRVYVLTLESDSCRDNRTTWTTVPRTKFWYPDDMRAAELVAREADLELDRLAVAPCDRDAIVNRDYEVEQRGGGWFSSDPPFVWTPERVCDDGIRTYIQLPAAARYSELPVLYLIGDNGEKELLNYAPRGDVIIADRVLRRAALIVNSGGKELRIDLNNRALLEGEPGGD
jgi:type IV secretion system protein VirB9